MDQREPPRIVSPAGRPRDPDAGEPAPRRFARFAPPTGVRKLAPNRLALAAFGALGAVVLVIAAGSYLVRQAIVFVHAQPANRLTFRQIRLVPDPPDWYRGGRDAFLDRVATDSGFAGEFSRLDVDLAKLEIAFKRNPFVKEVSRVELGASGKLVVRLVYHQPVAVAQFRTDHAPVVLGPAVDGEGVLLPRGEIDADAASPLIRLHNFERPYELRYGEFWSRLDPGSGVSRPDERVRGATRIAAFLRSRLGSERTKGFPRVGEPGPPPRFYVLRWGEAGYYVQVGPNLLFRWKDARTNDPAAGLTDEAKWEMLRDWVAAHQPPAAGAWADLRFTPKGVVPATDRDEPERAGEDRPGESPGSVSRSN